jgi:hypothetical protein
MELGIESGEDSDGAIGSEYEEDNPDDLDSRGQTSANF